ncbi:MAG: hypothetical protein V3S25_08065 [Nitrospirales bacterium]
MRSSSAFRIIEATSLRLALLRRLFCCIRRKASASEKLQPLHEEPFGLLN